MFAIRAHALLAGFFITAPAFFLKHTVTRLAICPRDGTLIHGPAQAAGLSENFLRPLVALTLDPTRFQRIPHLT